MLLVMCSTNKATSDWNDLEQKGQFTDYFKFAFKNQESVYFDSVCNVLSDSVLINSLLQIQISEVIDSINNKIEYKFSKKDLSALQGIKCRNIFMVCIITQDSILVEEKKCEIHDITVLAKEYIENPHENPSFSEKKLIYIENFGNVGVPKAFINIGGDFKTNTTFINSNWETYFKAIDQILKAYHELRDGISMRMWKTDFNKLEFRKKADVTKLYPINFLLNFDSFCTRPIIPLPPDSLVLEVLKIIDD